MHSYLFSTVFHIRHVIQHVFFLDRHLFFQVSTCLERSIGHVFFFFFDDILLHTFTEVHCNFILIVAFVEELFCHICLIILVFAQKCCNTLTTADWIKRFKMQYFWQLNCKEPKIQFTIEREKNYILAFLEILIHRLANRLATKVYCKGTHTQK